MFYFTCNESSIYESFTFSRYSKFLRCICVYIYSGENNNCWFCTFAHWQRKDQSIILMVGLIEQWETESQQKNPEKHISKKL